MSGKWENAISLKQMDNVRKETHIVSAMIQRLETVELRHEKDDRLLPHQIRRPRLTERYPQKDQATEEKALQIKDQNSVPRNMDNGMQRVKTLHRSDPHTEFGCVLRDNARVQSCIQRQRSCQGLHSIEVVIPSKQNLHTCSWVLISRGLNQYIFQVLDLQQSVAEETERTPPGEEGSHSEERPCANPTKLQPPSDQRKQAIIDRATISVKAALPIQDHQSYEWKIVACLSRGHRDLLEECRFLLDTQHVFFKQEKDPTTKLFDADEWIRSDTEVRAVIADIPEERITHNQHEVDPKKVRPIQMGEFMREYVSRRLLALSEGDIAALTTAMRQLGVGSQGGGAEAFRLLPPGHL